MANKKTATEKTNDVAVPVPATKDIKVKAPKKVKEVKPVKEDVKVEVDVKEVVVSELVNEVVKEEDLVSEVLPSPCENITAALGDFSLKIQALNTLINTLKSDYKVMEKAISREVKIAQKGRRRRNNGNRQPSGFRKPANISNELAVFLGKENGVEMARTDVSKEIHKYIKDNKLQDTANGRNIVPDVALAALLGVTTEDKLTYFNLQKFLKHHFIKTEVAV